MNCIRKNIPNGITCLNALSGVAAIIFALKGETVLAGLPAYQWGFIFIGIAAVADFLDGFMARLLGAYSDMGKELDSLCDAISFGVAPGMLLFAALDGNPLQWFALLIPVAGVLRLARFNVDTRQTVNFIGMPIPANAIFWIGYTSYLYDGADTLRLWFVLLPVLLLVCWLMLSPLPLFSLKFKSWGWKGNEFRWILIIAAPALVIFLGVHGFMWLIFAYLTLGALDATRRTGAK